MPKKIRMDKVRRDDGPLRRIRAIADGITASEDCVWAWVLLPTRSTDDLNTDVIHRLTDDGASALRRHVPAGGNFQFKIQWGVIDGDAYVEEMLAPLGEKATDGQRRYATLGGRRINQLTFPDRQVIFGIEIPLAKGDALDAVDSTAGGEEELDRRAEANLRRAAEQAWAWHEQMHRSTFGARAATTQELAWALRHDLRRTVTWLPDGSLLNDGQLARLRDGGYAVPQVDHMQLDTDRGTSYLRMLVPTRHGFPGSAMELPGSEWLRELTIADGPDADAAHPIEVSIRGRNLPSREAVKIMASALHLTQEQEREAAKGVAQTPPQVMTESRAVLEQRIKEVQQGVVHMVIDNVVWIVEAPSKKALDRRSQAVIDQYGDAGISLWAPKHVQDVLYKETVLGDKLRFADCEQLRPWTSLVGGWFHGGSTLGRGEGPFLASIIGSTPGVYRDRLSDAQLQNRPVTSAFVGATRAGKSTAVMLATGAEVIWGAWGAITDDKGDLHGICDFVRSFGVPVTELDTTTAASGSMDFFRYVDAPMEAASMSADYLTQILPPTAGDLAEPLIRAAANIIAHRPQEERSTHAVIEHLRHVTAHDTSRTATAEAAREVGEQLAELARDPLAIPVAGPYDPHTAQRLPRRNGLVYMRFADLRMPGRRTAQANWKPGQRLSVALKQAGLAYITYVASKVKGIPKIVALTELHTLTPYDFGADFIGFLVRTAAALDVNVLLDTQAVAELISIEGLLDQVSQVYAFGVNTDREADAQAELLHLTPEQAVRDRQQSWEPGQCEARDRWGTLAPLQWDYLTAEIRTLLSTTPERFDVDEDDEDEALDEFGPTTGGRELEEAVA